MRFMSFQHNKNEIPIALQYILVEYFKMMLH